MPGTLAPHRGKDGRQGWVLRLDVRDADGVRHQPQRTVYGSRREARRQMTAWEAEVARDVATATAARQRKWSVAELLTYWLDTYIAGRRAVTTEDHYRNHVRRYLVPLLGARVVQAVTPLAVQQMYRAMEDGGASDLLVREAHTLLCAAFDVALSPLGLIATNPARAARLPARRGQSGQGKLRPPVALTQEQAHALLGAMDRASPYGPLYALLLTTGLRRGEGLGLRWCDVDWEAGTISVVQQVTPRTIGGGYSVHAPKSASSARVVRLPPPTLEALRHHHSSSARVDGLVFARADGSPVTPDMCRHGWEAVLAAAGDAVPHCTMHDARHTFISLALLAGVPLQVVSRWAGHSKPSITMDIYGFHVHDAVMDSALEVITGLFYPP
jgi:integrase